MCSYALVEVTETVYDPQVMYNMTVAEAHTYFVGDDGCTVHNAKCGRDIFGEVQFQGLVQNRPLQELTHNDIIQAFRHTPYKLSNHAIMRLKHIRTHNVGIRTPNDVARVLNKGSVEPAGGGLVSVSTGKFEAIVNPLTNVIVTFSPCG